MKRCPKCNQEKEDIEFSINAKGKINCYCKSCQREYCRKHYIENKQKHNDRRYTLTKKTTTIHRLKIQELKKDRPCIDCGVIYPHYVMHFDHLCDKSDKVSEISNMIGKYTWNRIEEEIAKCELVCANCHFERTWQRYNKNGV